MAPEIQALAGVLASRFGRPPHVAERDALHILNELGSQHWQLDRTAQGLRIDLSHELAAEAAHQKAA